MNQTQTGTVCRIKIREKKKEKHVVLICLTLDLAELRTKPQSCTIFSFVLRVYRFSDLKDEPTV